MSDRWRADEGRQWTDRHPWDRDQPEHLGRGRSHPVDPRDTGWRVARDGGFREEGRSFGAGGRDQDSGWRESDRYGRGRGRDWRDERANDRGFSGFSGYGSERAPDYHRAGDRYGVPYGPQPGDRRDHEGGPAYGRAYAGEYGGAERDWWDRARDEVSSWFGGDDHEHHRRGEHHGRGPKGYVRSDDRIREDVNDRLTYDGWLDASNIDVVVDKAEVTLTGTVGSRADKRRAEDIADSIHGVKHVQNNLRIEQADQEETRAMGPTVSGPRTGRVM